METLLKSECALPQTQEVVSPKPVHCVSGEKIDFLSTLPVYFFWSKSN